MDDVSRERSKEMNTARGLDEHDKHKDRASVDAGQHTKVAKNPEKDRQESDKLKAAMKSEADSHAAEQKEMPKSKDKNKHKDKDKAKVKGKRLDHAIDQADTKAD